MSGRARAALHASCALALAGMLAQGCACAPDREAPPPHAAESPPAAPRTIEEPQNGPTVPEPGQSISTLDDVFCSVASLNAASGEAVDLRYDLGQPDEITVRVWDPDGGLARTLVDAAHREPGAQRETWDGRDEDGRIVPDEAYTFTIETRSGVVHDPTTFSGGVVGDITDARFNRESGTVEYRLPSPARVLIRLGIQSGPMLKTLVDWDPRVGGAITEYWDGRDEDKLIRLREHEDFTALITYVTLPDTTVVAYGNGGETYRDYKLGRGRERSERPERPRQPGKELRLRPENLVPPAWARAPRVRMTLPRHRAGAGGIPVVRGAVDVLVDVALADRGHLLRDQFEIIFFVDNVFFAEAERGYLPFNWRWELNLLPPGEHVLTVNVSSFRGQVGLASLKVRVEAG